MNSTSPRPIVVPTDFSEGAELALTLAVRFAKLLGAPLTLLHVYPNPPPYLATGQIPVAAPPPPLSPEVFENVQARLDSLCDTGRQAGVGCEIATLDGGAAEAIVEHAKKVAAELIVMGTHGRTGWRRALLGSVAEQVLRHATCPVVVVPLRERG